jgi:endonuclease/exonuclease/phosphatase family metal-dependent hydrolase
MPFTLATFNVKDLFDPPEIPQGKLGAVAAELERADADVVALQEIGSESALGGVLARVSALGYTARVVGAPDKRGIRNALVSRLPIASSRVHTSPALEFPRFVEGDPPPFGARVPLRRAIVQARVVAPGTGEIEVLVGHFKSGRAVPLVSASGAPVEPETDRARAEGMLRALVARASEALFVRGLVDGIFAADAGAKLAVAGDLNDVWGSLPLRIVAGEGATRLSPCAAMSAPEERWSIWHDGARHQIDHVLASPALHARLASARFLNAALRDHSRLLPTELPTVDSDHAALVVRFG